MRKEILENNKIRFTGTILDFNYDIERDSDEDFEEWIKPKLTRYKMDPMEKRIYQHMLGIDEILARILALEKALGI